MYPAAGLFAYHGLKRAKNNMLAYLKGTIVYQGAGFIILETGGVGYQVLLAPHQLEKTKVGAPATYFTFEYVYEDHRELYGFAKPQDLEFFLLLLGVQGVGPRSAQKIIAFAPVEDIKAAIIAENFTFLSGIPRLGTKTAGKLILELKPKLTHTKKAPQSKQDDDIEEALKRLGYSTEEIQQTLGKLQANKLATPEEKIKAALKLLKK